MFEDMSDTAAGNAARWRFGASQILVRAARQILDFEPKGSMVVEMPNGQKSRFGTYDPEYGIEPVLVVRRFAAFWKAFRRGSLGFAEAYIDGDITCNNLVAVFLFFRRNQPALEACGKRWFKVRGADTRAHQARANSRLNTRRNISEHYDLGNDFFRLWLDPSMLYSSAVYNGDTRRLEDAQLAKVDLILDHLEPQSGEHILEIGCGWGALARHAIKYHDVRVTGITLSHEQRDWAVARAKEDGLFGEFDARLEDYRQTEGTFDRIMSVEMIEAVGEAYWPTYFRTLYDRLRPGGTAVIQAITIDEAMFPAYRATADFIQRYIFPGGLLPTKTAIHEESARAGLNLTRSDVFGLSYAETLLEWRRRFEAAWPDIEKLGFDARFRRIWRYYLTYCEAGFRDGLIDVGVYRLEKPQP